MVGNVWVGMGIYMHHDRSRWRSRAIDRSLTGKRRRRDLVMMEMAKAKWWRPSCRYARDDGLIPGYGERARINSLTRAQDSSMTCLQGKRFPCRLRHNYSWRGGAPFLAHKLCSRGLHRHIHDY